MLPLISEETKTEILEESLQDVNAWRKKMIHYLKEENPEVNTAIIESAEQTKLDPKAIALGAYLIYIMLEKASRDESGIIEKFMD